MGKKNKERRAAKRRRRDSGPRSSQRPVAPPRSAGGGRTEASPPSDADLVSAALQFWGAQPRLWDAAVEELQRRGARDAVTAAVTRLLDSAWRKGWTPRDLAHLARRELSAAHADAVAAVVVGDAAARHRRGEALHPRWLEQVDVARLHADTGATLPVLLAVGALLLRLPPLPVTVPAPGTLEARNPAAIGLDARILERVRNLLAKAESTEFEQESEALTAKAQELIARHAIDEALLASRERVGEPSTRRLVVDAPYADEKAALLHEIGEANRCRTVYSPGFGWVTAIGYDADLDALELLGASLLAQATATMIRCGPRRDARGRVTTTSFRRSFLLGFAYRIGQRLRTATDGQVQGASADERGRFLPVLQAREAELDAAVAAAFPQMLTKARTISNGDGWVAGRAAADLASLDIGVAALR